MDFNFNINGRGAFYHQPEECQLVGAIVCCERFTSAIVIINLIAMQIQNYKPVKVNYIRNFVALFLHMCESFPAS